MSGFSKNEAKGVIKGALAPDFRKLICAVKSSGNGILAADTSVNGGSVEGVGLISTGTDSVSTGVFDNTSQIRHINIVIRENVRVTVDITLQDDTSYQHIAYGGSYSHDIPLNQPAIKQVVATVTEATASDVTINYSSETIV